MCEIDELLKRANVRNICAFLRTGEGLEENEQSKRESYESRKEEGEKDLYELLKSVFSTHGSEQDEALLSADKAINANQAIYMELGISIGIRLVVDAFVNRPPV